jgi:hypothetical protein
MRVVEMHSLEMCDNLVFATKAVQLTKHLRLRQWLESTAGRKRCTRLKVTQDPGLGIEEPEQSDL